MSKLLIASGVVLVAAGLLWNVLTKIPYIGRLPGDFFVQKKNFTFYFPLTTSILMSIFLSLILWFLSKNRP